MYFVRDFWTSPDDPSILGRGATPREAVDDACRATGDDYRFADDVARSLDLPGIGSDRRAVEAVGIYARDRDADYFTVVWTSGQWSVSGGGGVLYGGVIVEDYETEDDLHADFAELLHEMNTA